MRANEQAREMLNNRKLALLALLLLVLDCACNATSQETNDDDEVAGEDDAEAETEQVADAVPFSLSQTDHQRQSKRPAKRPMKPMTIHPLTTPEPFIVEEDKEKVDCYEQYKCRFDRQGKRPECHVCEYPNGTIKFVTIVNPNCKNFFQCQCTNQGGNVFRLCHKGRCSATRQCDTSSEADFSAGDGDTHV